MAKKFLDLDGLDEVVTQIKSLLLDKQDTLTAGDNITIQTINDVLTISAEGGVEQITSATNIWELTPGVYYGELRYMTYKTGSVLSSDAGDSGLLVVDGIGSAVTGKAFAVVCGDGQFIDGFAKTDTGNYTKVNIVTIASGKVDRIGNPSIVYATDSSGQQTSVGYGTSATAGNIVQRAAGGQITVPTTPSSNTDATSKSYVDTGLSGKQATLTTAQQNAVNSGITSALVTQIGTNQTNISTINGKIPSQASSTNQLADKDFVNSSIQTQTAHFRGNWANWSAVPTSASSYPADDDGNTTPTSNDYMVVQDASGYTGETLVGTWRFKYSGVWSTNGKNGWLPEYQVNETPLTAEQLAAINSGITSTLVGQISTNATNISNKVSTYATNSSFWDTTPTANSTKPVTSGGIKTALDGKEDTMTAITTQEIDDLFNA